MWAAYVPIDTKCGVLSLSIRLVHDVASAEPQQPDSPPSEADSTGEDISEVRQDSGDWVPASWVPPDEPAEPRPATPRRRRLPEIPKCKKRTSCSRCQGMDFMYRVFTIKLNKVAVPRAD